MKKLVKSLILTLLVVAMLLNTCGIVLADTIATMSVTQEVVDAANGVYKLVFKLTSASSATADKTHTVFSFDNTVIQPVNKAGYADVNVSETTKGSQAAPLTDPIKSYMDMTTSTFYAVSPAYWMVDDSRTAISTDTYVSMGTAVNTQSGFAFLEFYFKYKDAEKANSETFKLETDYSEGSFLKTMYPDPTGTAASAVVVGDFTYGTASAEDTETIAAPTFTYTGSDKLVLKELEITNAPESIAVPTVYPAEEAEEITFTAKAMSTIDTEMTGDAFPAVTWRATDLPAGVTWDAETATLTVAPGAKEGVVALDVTSVDNAEIYDKAAIRIARATPVVSELEIKVDGQLFTGNAITVVKPVTEGATAKKVEMSERIYDQYGDGIAGSVRRSWVDDKHLDGIGLVDGGIQVVYGAADGVSKLKLTASDSVNTIEKIIEFKVCGLDVTWPTIMAKENLKYGVQYKDTLDGVPSGTVADAADVDGTKYDGIFEVVDGTDKPSVGDAKVTVKFTVTEDGAYKGVSMTTDYSIAIAKADYDMSGVSLENKEVAYGDNAAVAITGTLPEGVTAEITYESAAYASSTTAPTAVGVYTVTAAFTGADTDNYNTIDSKEATLTIKDEAARYTTVAPTATMTAYEAAETYSIEDLDDAKTYMNLPATVDVTYGDGQTTTADVEWADATQTWNAKSGTYTFVGTVADPETYIKMGSDYKTITATLTINPSTATAFAWGNASYQDVIPAKVQVKKDLIAGAIGYPDINLQEVIKITLGENDSNVELVYGSIEYDKSVDDIKALNLAIGATTTVTPVIADLPDWMTVTLPTITIEVTDKDEVTVSVTIADTIYGTDLADPQPSQTDAGYGTEVGEEYNAYYTYTYAGRGDTVYQASENKPTAAGKYTVTATYSSVNLSGSGSADFTIAPKPITVTVGNAAKVYGEELPTFALVEPIDGLVDDDVLGATFTTAATKDSDVGEYDIEVESWANKNYAVTPTKGTLTITRKALTEVPVITGTAAVGSTLTAATGISAEEFTFQWYAGGVAIEGATAKTYTPAIKDSNKAITVKITAIENYEGEKTSTAVTVDKYEITGSIEIVFETDNGIVGTIDATDVLAVDTTGINNYADLVDAGISLEYIWKINGTQVATGTTYTVPAETAGVLTVEIATAAEGNFVGSIESGTAEINKIPLAGTITVTNTEGVLTADTTAVSGVAGSDYDVIWTIDGEELTLVEGAYTVQNADLGKTVTVKAVAKGDIYTGEVVATYNIPAKKPSDVTISTVKTATTIKVTVSALANGADITSYTITITDGAEFTDTYTGAENAYTFEGLTTGTEYTITATATNSVDTSEAATTTATPASTSRPRPSTPSTPSTPTTPDAGEGEGTGSEGTEGEGTTTPDADVTVKVEDTTASIDKEVIADKEAVEVATETESGTTVKTTVDLADAKIESIEVSTKDSEKAAAGAAAEGAIGTPVEVKVDAKDAEGNKVDVTVNVAIPSEEKAYAYIVDENGVATRTESVYNEETGEVEVANVPDGAVVMLSTTAPATFDDAAAHWAEETINYAADAGIMNGVGGSSFDPDGDATRGMVNAMMVRLAKVTGAELAEAVDHKVDTDAAHWAAATDLIALANGWTTGVRTLEDGTVVMDTDATVTREQLVTMLWRFVANPEAEGEIESFDDHHETSDWAKEAKAWAVGAGIINGKPGNVLDPNGTATRAEIATMFGRLMAYMTK